jgi:hypothetical protein
MPKWMPKCSKIGKMGTDLSSVARHEHHTAKGGCRGVSDLLADGGILNWRGDTLRERALDLSTSG